MAVEKAAAVHWEDRCTWFTAVVAERAGKARQSMVRVEMRLIVMLSEILSLSTEVRGDRWLGAKSWY